MFDHVFRAARASGFALIAGLALASTAPAATLGTFTHNYGNDTGQFDPNGNDVLSHGFVTVSDQSSARFNDSFDFSSLSYSSINSLALTLTFSRAGPSFFFVLPTELWAVRIQGSNPAGFLDDQFAFLSDAASPQTTTISAATDNFLVNAFAQSVATQSLAFWFSEFSFGGDNFRLASATLTVDGVAAVPLPAGGLMLMGALAGLGALRRRKAARAV
jgi:hypothetical protein